MNELRKTEEPTKTSLKTHSISLSTDKMGTKNSSINPKEISFRRRREWDVKKKEEKEVYLKRWKGKRVAATVLVSLAERC